MTALASLYNNNFIVMAADSLFTTVDNYQNLVFQGYTSIQKIFLIGKTRTGISVIGNASYCSESIDSILKNFSSKVLSPNDTQETVIYRLENYINNNYPNFETEFHVGGFSNGYPYLFSYKYGSQIEQHKNGILFQMSNNVIESLKLILSKLNLDTISYLDAIEAINESYDVELKFQNTKIIPQLNQPIQDVKSIKDVDKPIDILVLQKDTCFFHNVKDSIKANII